MYVGHNLRQVGRWGVGGPSKLLGGRGVCVGGVRARGAVGARGAWGLGGGWGLERDGG